MFRHLFPSSKTRPGRRAVAGATAAVAVLLGMVLTPAAVATPVLPSALPLDAASTFEGGDAGLGPTSATAHDPSATPPGRTDWRSYTGAGALPGLRTLDDPPAQDSMFSGGDKETEPGAWGLTTKADGVTPGKDDVRAAWGIPDQRASSTYLYLGFKRSAANGNTYLTFELNQAGISWNNGNASIPCRQTGDVLISYEITPSGTPVDIVPYRWTSTTTQAVTTGGHTYQCAKTGTVADLSPVTPLQAQASVNWGAGPFSGTIDNRLAPATFGAQFGEGLFAEAALNLNLILGSAVGADPCSNFGQFQVHSRSSTSISSQLQDLVGPGPIDVRSCGVKGFKFHDLNGDGVWQKTGTGAEPGLAGWRIYVDLNDDGDRDSNEPFATTAAAPAAAGDPALGSYEIGGVPAGDHSVREEPPADAASGWRCTAPAADSSLPGPAALDCGHVVHFTNGTATQDVDGDPVDFGNFLVPKLTVVKHVVNDSGGTAQASAFQMDVTANSPSDAHFPGSEAGETITLGAGAYSVNESGGPTGYTAELSAGCTGTVKSGDSKSCTITNDDQPAHLTVIKRVVNDSGGSAAASAFQMDVTASDPSDAHFPGSEAGTAIVVDAGSYSVDESGGPSGYAKSLSADCAGSIALGQEKTCTITNDDLAATLTVVKHVVNGDGGSAAASAFQMDVTATSPSDAHFPGTEAGKTISLSPGSYSVDESGGPSGYAKSLSADCAGSIALGQHKTCTITNNDIAPRLTVTKHVINDSGGSAAASAFQMDVTATSPSDAHFPGTEAGKTITLHPGSYSVDESGGPSGYAKSLSASCAGTIALGQAKSCTITNNDIAPKLTVIKHVIGGLHPASAFTMNVAGGHVSDASFAGAEAPGTTVTLDAGSYSVDEAAHDHYVKQRSAGCEGTLAPGEERTCTITNTRMATVVVEKRTDPPQEGDEKTPFGFHTALPGAATFSLTHGATEQREVVPGTYTVSEDDPRPAGYKLTGLACTESVAGDSTVPSVAALADSRLATIVAHPGEAIRCVFINTKVLAGIEVVKSGPAFAYHGDTLEFEFAVTNVAPSPLHAVKVTDDRCAAVSAEPVRRVNDDGDALLDHVGADGTGPEQWIFQCSMAVPAHASSEADPLVNTALASGEDELDRPVEGTDTHSTDILHPAIALDKAGPATALAGSLVAYMLRATNPGDQPFADGLVKLSDPRCEAPPALVGKNGDASPGSLDPGDAWTYSCSVQTQLGETAVHNTATVTGTDPHGKVVTDDAAADTVLSQPAAGVAGVKARSAQVVPGAAKLRGPSGCASKPTKAYVTGKRIASVSFTLDGRRIAKMSRPNSGSRYQVKIRPRTLRRGVHRVVARITFVPAAQTKAKTLRLAFQRCGRITRVRFTG